ncbi:MAG: hypothetical protein CAF45_003420 [Nitrospira sp. CG24E]|nr:MAG: hypothetical protein CAF45_003420 [Nitrospira sp. CG24E]
MKPDEEHCAASFQCYIESLGRGRVTYTAGPNPPDYIFQADSKELAVEITSIVDSVAVGGRAMLETSVFASLTRVAESICADLLAESWLSGRYVIHFEPVPGLKKSSRNH